ncbi:hypothetical protein B4064_0162 [Caldibacillus thermoamylovorans]|nr:hypothetical protein B4064_0162 [Caldibacillus thermoamylovorans]
MAKNTGYKEIFVDKLQGENKGRNMGCIGRNFLLTKYSG